MKNAPKIIALALSVLAVPAVAFAQSGAPQVPETGLHHAINYCEALADLPRAERRAFTPTMTQIKETNGVLRNFSYGDCRDAGFI